MTRAVRVLHIASGDLWAGAEVQAFTLISHLARMPDIEVAAVLMNEGTLAGRLRSSGITLQVIDEARAGPIRIFSELRSFLKSWQPDVIHTHREKENILGSLANRSAGNVAAVRTMHGGKEHSGAVGWRGVRRRTVEELDRWCGCRLQDRVIAVTRDLAARVADEFPAEKVVVIENGIDVERIRRDKGVAEFRAAAPDRIHIGIVGRLAIVKRIDLFIEAATLLLREAPERKWQFHVIGDGPLLGSLQSIAAEAGVGGRIRFHGHRDDIAVCIASLDAVVICSDHEGMPMTALEAAALGVPTVAHAVGGLVEVVPREFLVASHGARGYADGVLRALQGDGRDISNRCATDVLPRFTARGNAERVRALYGQVIAERHGKCNTLPG